MAITFRGQPTARFIRGSRAEIAFYTISSEIFQKTEQELLAYEMPITKIIEENSVKDIQEIEDREFTITSSRRFRLFRSRPTATRQRPSTPLASGRNGCRVLDPQGRARTCCHDERRDGAPNSAPRPREPVQAPRRQPPAFGAPPHDGSRLGRHPAVDRRRSAIASSRRPRSTATSTTPSWVVRTSAPSRRTSSVPATCTSSRSRSSSGSSTC
jgi:hypothetical protein